MDILDTGISLAPQNMFLDERLLDELDPKGNPLIHFYGWEGPSATYGYFISPDQWFNLKKVESRGLTLGRRPTGGGIVFHIWDFAFSFLMPSGHPAFSLNTLENYRFVNKIVLEVMEDLFNLNTPLALIESSFESIDPDCNHFCMAKPTQYDVVYEGMKIAGAAQRRRKQGYLHQGTISLGYPDIEFLKEVLLSKDAVVSAMSQYTFAPLGKCSIDELNRTRSKVQLALQEKFIEKLNAIAYSSSNINP